MNNKIKKNSDKIGEDLLIYLERFANFSDEAAPSPEIEIKVKGSAKEFFEKYLKDSRYFLLDLNSSIIHLHCKPRHILRLIDLEELIYINKVSGLYEPM